VTAVSPEAGVDPILRPLTSRLPAVDREPVVPGGFRVGGTVAGIKASGRPDLAIVAADPGPAAVAAVFTANAFAAAPVRLSQAHLAATEPAGGGRFGWTSAVISTSGSANAATGPLGATDQLEIAGVLAAALGTTPELTLALSTGVIGTRLPVDRVRDGVARLIPGLGRDGASLEAAAEALRTTDSRPKVATVSVALPDPDGLAARPVRVTGIAKGVGMIHPQMATMLSLILTDATAEPALLYELLKTAATRTWNQLSVDGDTSTNDTVFLLASGAAGTAPIVGSGQAATTLAAAIEAVARDLARQQAADGEGASTLVTCQVSGAATDADARAVARAVVSSSLVKAAVHGRDPNWGRIAGAAGNAVAALDPDRLRIAIGGHLVFDGPLGGPVAFDRAAASEALAAEEALFRLDLGLGDGSGEAFGCDLTEEYVRENSEYTT
jgi:glutamate N-acetyltransferase / amino-acid N-acetyltransferase